MTNTLHFSEWRNYIRAQRKVNLYAPGAPKGPKVGMVVRQYEMLCANDAGRSPRKYPVVYVFICGGHHDSDRIAVLVMVYMAESIVLYLSSCIMYACQNKDFQRSSEVEFCTRDRHRQST